MSNMNRISYKGRTFTDSSLAIGGNLVNSLMMHQALISEELKPDTFVFNVIYDPDRRLFLIDADGKYLTDADGKLLTVLADSFDPEAFHFGDPLSYYINNGDRLVGRFYVRAVRRISKKIYRFECISGIGMLTYRSHDGGIYSASTVGAVISDIMGPNVPYTIDNNLASVSVNGWLPRVASARDNLRAVLFMSGGSVKMNSDGSIRFGYITNGTPYNIGNTRLAVGGTVSQLAPATRVEVMSHEYYARQSDESVLLFDNTNGMPVTGQIVEFSEPCHDLVATGLTIGTSNANYAIVSGSGTLVGQKYTHSTSLYALETNVPAEPNIIQITDNYLINPRNVANTAQRIGRYYSIAKEVNYTQRLAGERPGTKVTFQDPFGEQQTGFIKSMNVTLSHNLNSNTTIALDWTPGPFGDSYSKYKNFYAADIENGRLTIPDTMVGKQAFVVMLSGAGGGQGGYDGEAGEAPSGEANYYDMTPGMGGAGGEPGQPGERGRIYTFYEDTLPAYYDNAAIGLGGDGGASGGGLGSPGGDTTLGTYSTQNGTQMQDSYVNFLSGVSYGDANEPGIAGGAGGIGAGRGTVGLDSSTRGESVVGVDGVTRSGGAYANGESYRYNARTYNTGGAGGGGAANGIMGNAGISGQWGNDNGSWGGDGANAYAPSAASVVRPGRGGNGGGGGGGAAQCYSKGDTQTGFSYGFNTAGSGGTGSAGGKGGSGLIIIYYNPS